MPRLEVDEVGYNFTRLRSSGTGWCARDLARAGGPGGVKHARQLAGALPKRGYQPVPYAQVRPGDIYVQTRGGGGSGHTGVVVFQDGKPRVFSNSMGTIKTRDYGEQGFYFRPPSSRPTVTVDWKGSVDNRRPRAGRAPAPAPGFLAEGIPMPGAVASTLANPYVAPTAPPASQVPIPAPPSVFAEPAVAAPAPIPSLGAQAIAAAMQPPAQIPLTGQPRLKFKLLGSPMEEMRADEPPPPGATADASAEMLEQLKQGVLPVAQQIISPPAANPILAEFPELDNFEKVMAEHKPDVLSYTIPMWPVVKPVAAVGMQNLTKGMEVVQGLTNISAQFLAKATATEQQLAEKP